MYMKKINGLKLALTVLLFTLTLFVCITAGQWIGTYAVFSNVQPNCEIVVGQSSAQVGVLFDSNGIAGNTLAPGEKTTGLMRISNKLGKEIKITRLGMAAELEKDNQRVHFDTLLSQPTSEGENGNEFLTHMKISIDFLNPVEAGLWRNVFSGSFYSFLQGKDWNYKLGTDRYVDLVYTIELDGAADNRVAGISALADFLVSVEEVPSIPGGTPTGSTNTGTPSGEELIDFEDEEIPLGEAIPGRPYVMEAMEFLAEKKIITPYSDGSYHPEWNTTRGEIAVYVCRMLGIQPSKAKKTYKDVIPMFVKGYIMAGTEKGFLTGYPDGTFRSNNKISREETTAVITSAFQLKAQDESPLPFTDNDKIKWSKPYIKACYDEGLIVGHTDGSFRPANKITRAELFVILYNLYKNGLVPGGEL